MGDIRERKLEVPYNFDKDLITALSIIDPLGQHIHCIYTAPFRPDYRSAKYEYEHHNEGINIAESQQMTREEYESHISNINEKFPKKLMLLLQQTSEEAVMSDDLLKYYLKLGFRKFCVGSIAQAKAIYRLNPLCEITASIAMKLEPEDINNNLELRKYFQSIVLWFPYNRDLDKINALPGYFNYVLLVNCTCSTFCDGTHHWFADKQGELDNFCPNRTHDTLWTQIRIRPSDMSLFTDKIAYFKLQGREYKTNFIIEDFILYTSNSVLDYAIKIPNKYLYTKKTEEELAKLEIDAKVGKINYDDRLGVIEPEQTIWVDSAKNCSKRRR